MSKRTCTSDDCECNHCPKCGSHTIGRLEQGEECDSCQIEREEKERPDSDGLFHSGRMQKFMELTGTDLF